MDIHEFKRMYNDNCTAFVKKTDRKLGNPCESCCFDDICKETTELQYLIGYCEEGEYWEIINEFT